MEYQQDNPTNEEVNSNSNTYSEAVDGAGVNAFVNALIDGEGSGLATVSAEACGLGGTTFNECTDLFSLPKLLDADGTDTGVGSTQTSPRPTAVLPIPTIATCPCSSVPIGPTGQSLVSPPTTQKTYSTTAEFATVFATMIFAIWISFVIAGCILKYIHTTILAAYDDLVAQIHNRRDAWKAAGQEPEEVGNETGRGERMRIAEYQQLIAAAAMKLTELQKDLAAFKIMAKNEQGAGTAELITAIDIAFAEHQFAELQKDLAAFKIMAKNQQGAAAAKALVAAELLTANMMEFAVHQFTELQKELTHNMIEENSCKDQNEDDIADRLAVEAFLVTYRTAMSGENATGDDVS